MFGENDLVDNLSRHLDRARGKRDALASDVTTLTAQIAEIEARLSEEKKRRERNHVLGEIEAIKKRIIQTASAFAPVVSELCEATEMAAAVVPEARELNNFLSSVATEVETVVDPLLRELDRRADAVRAGHAARTPSRICAVTGSVATIHGMSGNSMPSRSLFAVGSGSKLSDVEYTGTSPA